MRRLGAALARLFIKLRWIIVLAWIGGTVAVMILVPSVQQTEGASFTALVPKGSPAITAETVSAKQFTFPILTRTLVVVRDPRGLSRARQFRLALIAERLTSGTLPGFREIAAAVPVSNSLSIPEFTREHGTTMLMYLYFRPTLPETTADSMANLLVRQVIGHRPGEYEGVTGEEAGGLAQNAIISNRLPLVELATIVLVALALAVHFRAPGAAAITLVAIAVAYLMSDRAVAELARLTGATLPAQIRPVLVVLVLGITTDYSVFFLSRFRTLLRAGHDRREAATYAMREIAPIVTVAGLTVAVGTAGLVAASLGFLRSFGPGLAVAVLAAMLVAVTLVPAMLAIGGRAIFWPSDTAQATTRDARPRRRPLSAFTVRFAARHPLVASVVVVAAIAAAATGIGRMAVGNELVEDLPSNAPAAQAYDQAKLGFTPGILAPSVVVVSGATVGQQVPALARLQEMIAREPDVALVVGPRQITQIPQVRRLGFAVSNTGDAARYVVFLRSDPLGSRAIDAVRTLRSDLPQLMTSAHLTSARAAIAGDTAISADIVDGTVTSLERVIPAVLALIFLVIALYLRALVAPAYLMLTSVLGVLASLGLTVYVLQLHFGYGQTTYYVLFTVAVLLISLGSDYNVFVVGRIWQEGRRRALPEAVEVAGMRAAQPITTAGVVLAASFALLVIVPLRGFREIAFAMAVGLLIDAFVVRTILVPALLTLFGRRSAWPGHALRESLD